MDAFLREIWIACFLLLGIAAWIDFRSHQIPNWIILVGSVIGGVASLWIPEIHQSTSSFFGFMKGFAGFVLGIGSAFFILVSGGDIKLSGMLGWFFGWKILPIQLLAYACSTPFKPVPYAPFLLLAALCVKGGEIWLVAEFR